MNPGPTAVEPLSTLSGAGAASNEARLRLLEKRLAGQDSIELEAGASFPSAGPMIGAAQQLQPGAWLPRQPLTDLTFPTVQGAAQQGPPPQLVLQPQAQNIVAQQRTAPAAAGSNKRKRASSPPEHNPHAQPALIASPAGDASMLRRG
jgi:hypothetical protein